MDFYIKRRAVNETSSWYQEINEVLENRLLSLVNLPFPVLLLGFYCWKIFKNNTKCFSLYLSGHILMYITMFGSLIVLFCHKNFAIGSFLKAVFIIFMFFQGSIQLSILIIQYIAITFGKIIALLVGVILIFLRYLWENEVIILSVFNKEIRLDLIEISFFTCTVTCALIYFLSLKIGTKAKVDRKTISVFIHTIVFVSFYTVFQISTIFKIIIFNFTFWFSQDVDMFISDIYYFPFLWIISVQICGSKRIQKLIRDSEKSESQAFQMAQIPVTKKVDNENTTISYLSVADISIVV